MGVVASRCFPHSTLSLASEQTLKDPRGSSVEMRRVYLANWALRTSPKFNTGVQYRFHQGFWLDQRSGNPSHPSPPKIIYCTVLYIRSKTKYKAIKIVPFCIFCYWWHFLDVEGRELQQLKYIIGVWHRSYISASLTLCINDSMPTSLSKWMGL